MHVFCPSAEVFPAGQGVHCVAGPVAGEYVPPAHTEHAWAPGAAENVPFAHSPQPVAAAPDWKVPAAHAAQAVAPPVEYDPAAQVAQAVSPAPVANCPPGHWAMQLSRVGAE
jgi:hypothetical protein